MDDEYESEADDDFCHSLQQSSQSAHHGLDENSLQKEQDAFISNYQSDSKLLWHYISLQEEQIHFEILEEKNRNLGSTLALRSQSHPEFWSYDYPVARF